MLLPPGCVMVEVGTSSGAVSIASLEASRDQKHFPEFRFFGFKKKKQKNWRI